MTRYVTEFIGTFFLVIIIALSGNPIAIGSVLMAMIYMGGHISGAHYNPAVSLAVLIRGKLSIVDFGAYVLFQFAGAAVASLVGKFLTDKVLLPAPEPGATYQQAFLVEV